MLLAGFCFGRWVLVCFFAFADLAALDFDFAVARLVLTGDFALPDFLAVDFDFDFERFFLTLVTFGESGGGSVILTAIRFVAAVLPLRGTNKVCPGWIRLRRVMPLICRKRAPLMP